MDDFDDGIVNVTTRDNGVGARVCIVGVDKDED
jgi:hypothetical protein